MSIDIPFAEALQDLTGYEVIGIQKRYAMKFEELGGVLSLIGAVWAYRNREGKADWSTVERMTIRELEGFFAEPDDEPDSDQEKKLISSEPTPEPSPISASRRASRKTST